MQADIVRRAEPFESSEKVRNRAADGQDVL